MRRLADAIKSALLAVAFLLFVFPAAAQSNNAVTVPAGALAERIAQLPSVLAGKASYEDYFAASFLSAVPAAQIKAISDQIVAQNGMPLKVVEAKAAGLHSAAVKVEFEKAVAIIDITVEPAAPGKVIGLLVKGFEVKGDSLGKVEAEIKGLGGRTAYLVRKIDGGTILAQHNADMPMAIASSFKLYILSELAAQVASGKRKWSDVVALAPPVPSSAATDKWPTGAPVTLQTLAAQMISVSDNRATDSLIAALGRDAIEERIAKTGVAAPDKMFPLLTTTEAFVLKSRAELRNGFLAASEKEQRRFLVDKATSLTNQYIDVARFGAAPTAIDSIEWFASPADVAKLLASVDFADASLLSILAINPGVSSASAQRWRYLGFKGGSEPGVIAMNFLAQSNAGDWYAISGAWNNPETSVDNAAFAALMTRLLDIVATPSAPPRAP